jgi:uncharacterized protein YqeY
MLLDRLNDDLKTAMKAGDTARRDVLRMTLSEIKNARIEKGEDLADADVMQVLKKAIKSRAESAEQYAAGARQDLADKELAEAKLLEAYLPEQITGDALAKAVDEAIAQTGASSMKDMGGVMKALMAKHGAALDGKEAGALVKSKLAG